MAAYLFDSDAIVAALVSTRATAYARWLATVPREDQFASAATVAELYRAADLSKHCRSHRRAIRRKVLPALTVLPFDVAIASLYGELRATLERDGARLSDLELQVAATAVYHDLELVTDRPDRFDRVPGLKTCAVA